MDKQLQIYVVEGKNDYAKVKQILPDAIIYQTNGSALSTQTIDELVRLSSTYEIVLMLDPDFPGEKIRKTLMNAIPNAKQIFIPKRIAVSKNKRKVGIEHVDSELLRNFMDDVKMPLRQTNIISEDLINWGLIGTNNSKQKRTTLCNRLNIGYVNGKQLLKRLYLFGYTKEDIIIQMEKQE